jgi:hypothetical protein
MIWSYLAAGIPSASKVFLVSPALQKFAFVRWSCNAAGNHSITMYPNAFLKAEFNLVLKKKKKRKIKTSYNL